MTTADFITESLTFEDGRIYVVSGKDIDQVMALLDSAKLALEGDGRDVLTYDSRFATSYFFDSVVPVLPTRQDSARKFAKAHNAFAYDSVAPISLSVSRGTSEGAPIINSISPNFGPKAGGTTITITGENMLDVILVTFDGVPATIIGSPTATVVNVTSPAKSADGCVDVEVVIADKQAFLYEEASLSLGGFVVLVGNQFDPDDKRQNFLSAGIIVDTMLDLFEAINVLSVKASHSRRYGITRELWPFISRIYFYDVDTPDVMLIKPAQTPERPPFPEFPFITITQPDSTITLAVGDVFDIMWNTFEVPVGVDVKIELFKGGIFHYSITPSGTGVGYDAFNSGSFVWQVNNAPAGSDYQVKISTTSSPLVGTFSDFFFII